MKDYKIIIEEGDYLWDNDNQCLVKYKHDGSVIIGSIPPLGSNTAYPIGLKEDVLSAIGFQGNGKAEYVNGNNTIKIDGNNAESILVIENTPVRYVSDIQHFFKEKGEDPDIDETQLANVCKRNSTKC